MSKFDGIFADYRTPSQKLKDRIRLTVTYSVIAAVVAAVFIFGYLSEVNRKSDDEVRQENQMYYNWLAKNQCVRTGFVSNGRGVIHSTYRCAGNVVYIDYEIIKFVRQETKKE
jgi:hypothetical protein